VTGLDALLARHRLLPVLTVSGAERGERLGQALLSGGLPIAEVTLRIDGALDALSALATTGSVTVGAGTVLTVEQVDAAVDAGARFVVSPGLDLDVVSRCRELDVPVLPGVATPTEIMRALDAGLRTVKLFPADLLGGPAAVNAFAAPFPELRFVPTGGVRADHVSTYLSHPAVPAVGGSWVAPAGLVADGRWEEITRRTRDAVRAIDESTKEHP
jgi:2-dehydro-3-deoxyphosphogluconate aldolase / (4S)-4-hydroxy-2-oxoglutarate aldolase